jgi:hypothetical protein
MATKTTLSDINFAELYLDYISRQGTPETRARAKILIATMSMLDVKHPQWRTELIDELEKRNLDKDIKSMFPLPEVDDTALFNNFMSSILQRT